MYKQSVLQYIWGKQTREENNKERERKGVQMGSVKPTGGINDGVHFEMDPGFRKSTKKSKAKAKSLFFHVIFLSPLQSTLDEDSLDHNHLSRPFYWLPTLF